MDSMAARAIWILRKRLQPRHLFASTLQGLFVHSQSSPQCSHSLRPSMSGSLRLSFSTIVLAPFLKCHFLRKAFPDHLYNIPLLSYTRSLVLT